ncbi:MAG: FtsX-like permease family protein [Bacteroidota bacterium]
MNFPLFVSKRLRMRNEGGFSPTVIRISVWSVALGTAVLIIAFAVLHGFRDNIREKLFSFGAHLQVTRFSAAGEQDDNPVSTMSVIYRDTKRFSEVDHVQAVCYKPALLKTGQEVQGVVLKGVGRDFAISRFRQNIVSGRFIKFGTEASTDVLISRLQADKLNLGTGSEFPVFFLQNPPRARKLKVCGIYETGLEDFDENMLICDIRQIREVNNWPDTLANGIEVFLKDFNRLDEGYEQVYKNLEYDLGTQKITETHFRIFEWLNMIGRNVELLLVLITLVSCFNMVSTLLIMMLERTRMIGVLKALGAGNRQIKWVFIISGISICLRGLAIGNAIGLGFCALQYYFRLIPLDSENYYMSYVPIAWPWEAFIFLNVLTVLLCGLALLLPAIAISGMKPVKAIKFA